MLYFSEKVHNSIDSLFKKMDSRCLPKEMGGEVPIKDMITSWHQNLDEKRKRVMSVGDVELLSDRGIICSKNSSRQSCDTLVGSFRKLEVD